MSMPDMRGPISYALSYPKRLSDPIQGLELEKLKTLTFRKPDHATFPCLSYAYEAIRAGGTMPCVLNASNEAAVNAFLQERIGFNDIAGIIKKTVEDHDVRPVVSLEAVVEADRWARKAAEKNIKELNR